MIDTLFFYGTLRHVPLLEIVLGRAVRGTEMAAAVLEGYTVQAAAEGPFPILLAQEGAQAEGLLISGLTEQDIANLDYYEGGFDYDLIEVVLQNGMQAQVYICEPDRWQATGLWDFGAWCKDWAALSCHAATEVMTHQGKYSRQDVANLFEQIRRRAWARVLGAGTAAGQDVFAGDIKITATRRAYTGHFAVNEVDLRHSRFDGSLSPVLERSYFVTSDAALVLPYDPLRDRVLLVEQMRVGPLGRGDTEVWHLEPIAGLIDPGETAQAAAKREAFEEAALDIGQLEVVSRGYASPGDSTAYFHIFVGIADLPDGAAGIAGLEEEAENIRSRLVSFNDFIAMAEDQRIANTPLALLAYWLAHHRSRLRSDHSTATP